jgi:hypothetical protein
VLSPCGINHSSATGSPRHGLAVRQRVEHDHDLACGAERGARGGQHPQPRNPAQQRTGHLRGGRGHPVAVVQHEQVRPIRHRQRGRGEQPGRGPGRTPDRGGDGGEHPGGLDPIQLDDDHDRRVLGLSAVRTDSTSSSAISGLVSLRPIAASTSASRGVSASGPIATRTSSACAARMCTAPGEGRLRASDHRGRRR